MFRRTAFCVGALAAAALLLESALTRLLAVAQYYHFAFLVVSLALLGFGASGSFLSLRKSQAPNPRIYRLAGAGFAASTLLAYAVVNWLPFDSYTIAWERRQLLYFAFYYLILALPFFCSGVGIGAGLAIGGWPRAPDLRGEPLRGRRWACCWRWWPWPLAACPAQCLPASPSPCCRP